MDGNNGGRGGVSEWLNDAASEDLVIAIEDGGLSLAKRPLRLMELDP